MNTTILAAALVALVVSAAPLPAADPAPAPPNTQEFDKDLSRFQEQMNKMHEQMNRIAQTADPAERQKLLQEHWTLMQEASGTMHGMWGRGMGGRGGPGMGPGMGPGGGRGPGAGMGPGYGMGPGMMMNGWGHMRGYYSQLTPEQMRQRQYMGEQTMRMQQFMLDQMMQHQYWMAPGRPPVAPKK